MPFHQVGDHAETRVGDEVEDSATVDDYNVRMKFGDLLAQDGADLLFHEFPKKFILEVCVPTLIRQAIQFFDAGARPISIENATVTERDPIETGVVCDLL